MKHYFFPIVFGLSATLFTSCEKRLEPGPSRNLPHRQFVIHENANNPYDSWGHEHNYILDAIAEDASFPQLDRADLYNIAQAYLYQTYSGTAPISLNSVSGVFDDLLGDYGDTKADYLESDISDIFDRAASYFVLSNDGQAYLDLLENKFTDLSISAISTSTFLSDLVDIEDDIQNDDLSSDEETQLLLMYSVARNSIVYWNDALNNSENPWHNAFIDGVEQPGLPFLLIIIGVMDAVGAGCGVAIANGESATGWDFVFDVVVCAGIASGIGAL
jgi:hypothetical protein